MIYGLKVLKEDIQYHIDKQYKDTSYLCNTYLRIEIQTDLYWIQICSDLFDLNAYTIFLKKFLTVPNKSSFVTAGYIVKDLTGKTIHKFKYDIFFTNESDIILERIDKTPCPYNSLVNKFYYQVNLAQAFHTGI
jgi:hypothetical protein